MRTIHFNAGSGIGQLPFRGLRSKYASTRLQYAYRNSEFLTMSVEQNVPLNEKPRAAAPNNKRVLLLLIVVCVAPVIASYLAYYLLPPDGRTNYGDLLQPQQEVGAVMTMPLAGMLPDDEKARLLLDTPGAPVVTPAESSPGSSTDTDRAKAGVSLADWRGRWLIISIAPAACEEPCATNLYNMRQVRLTTGRDRDRVQRLWLITDGVMPTGELLTSHQGMVAARADPAVVNKLFVALDGNQTPDHIYLVDPLGNLMMRFPAQADPSRMKKDLIRLLKASRIG